MSESSNILLISNDEDVINTLKPKLILLRNVDAISSARYSDALISIKKSVPEIVLIYSANEHEDCLEVIQNIQADEKVKAIPILLVVDEYEQEFVLSAYDENITDYITLNMDDSEILIRVIASIKKGLLTNTVKKQLSLLKNLGIIDKQTELYASEYSDKIFENEFENLQSVNLSGVLMLISASEESKAVLSLPHLAQSIKNSVRSKDVVVHSSANRFYVLLEETDLKGAFCVWEKIKTNVGREYTINAGMSPINGKTFEPLKKELLNALVEAGATKQEVVIVNEEEKNLSEDWIEKINAPKKNFKLFKQAFNKKLNKVITPVFFQVQKLYEEKLFEIEIEQYSNEAQSSFILKKGDKISELKITYPGFAKINIDIIHQGLDSPENRHIGLDLSELNEKKLTDILEDFIKEFKSE